MAEEVVSNTKHQHKAPRLLATAILVLSIVVVALSAATLFAPFAQGASTSQASLSNELSSGGGEEPSAKQLYAEATAELPPTAESTTIESPMPAGENHLDYSSVQTADGLPINEALDEVFSNPRSYLGVDQTGQSCLSFPLPSFDWIASDAEAQDLLELLQSSVREALYDSPVSTIIQNGSPFVIRVEYGEATPTIVSIRPQEGSVEEGLERADEAQAAVDTVYAEIEKGQSDDAFAEDAFTSISSKCVYADDIDGSLQTNDAYGALLGGKSKCAGMSCALKSLLDKRGIENLVAFGTHEGTNHAWVVAWIDGEWKSYDLTKATAKASSTPEKCREESRAGVLPALVKTLGGLVSDLGECLGSVAEGTLGTPGCGESLGDACRSVDFSVRSLEVMQQWEANAANAL